MSGKVVNLEDRIPPMRITDNETGETYELDFSRESVKFAESRKFKIEEIADFPVTNFPELFYLAFRKNHKNIARDRTDKLYDKMGGLTANMVSRLANLYNQARTSNVLLEDEDLAKNGKVTVEL